MTARKVFILIDNQRVAIAKDAIDRMEKSCGRLHIFTGDDMYCVYPNYPAFDGSLMDAILAEKEVDQLIVDGIVTKNEECCCGCYRR